jgi:phospholipid/cholesterol/gamma-HCH transport system substrate-binding protein
MPGPWLRRSSRLDRSDAQMTRSFRDRDPVLIGAAGLLVIALALLAAFRAQDLPLIGGGDTYYARFSDAGGLKVNDEVRIAGVRSGKVTSIGLDSGAVKVGFTLDTDRDFGEDTAASIKIKTLLGAMYLSLEPAGKGQLAEGATIPLERTTSPYDVVEAFSGLAETSGDIDTEQLAASLTTLADLTRNTPQEFRSALRGVSALSSHIAARDDQINSLLKNLERVSSVLDARDQDIVGLMRDSDVLFRALVRRRQAVHNLLVSTAELSRELTALVRSTRGDLEPALDNLEGVLAVLNKNEDNLDKSLRLMAPFTRLFANVSGNGPWLDGWIQNVPPVPAP